jgi:glycosyltransferase involved in cell wall biosynthesis
VEALLYLYSSKANAKIIRENSSLIKQKLIEIYGDLIETTEFAKGAEFMDYRDLFYWEHRMGAWHSQVVAESDPGFDSVVLFDCRKLEILRISAENANLKGVYSLDKPAAPYVSVIMPVYNRQHTVYRAIQSVLDQSYGNFELIIVNDASTDKTDEIIRSFSDSRIRYIVHDRTMGASAARNTGIRCSKGEWIAFHDSDDEWMPNKLEKQVALLESSWNTDAAPIIYTGFYRFDRYGNREYIPSGKVTTKEGFILGSLLQGNFVSTQTVLIKKEYLVKAGGFDERLPRFQDWELWLRLAPEYPFKLVDEPLVHVNFTEGSISADFTRIVEAFRLIYNKHQELLSKVNPYDASCFLASYGHNLCLSGHLDEGREILREAMRWKPSSKRAVVFYAASFLGSKMYKTIYRAIKISRRKYNG